MPSQRPAGVSSRLRRAPGASTSWSAPNGQVVPLPLLLDVLSVNDSGDTDWAVEAVIDLLDAAPAVTSIQVTSEAGLDLIFLQTHFRWSTPLDVVTVSVPQLLERGIDAFGFDYPVRGFPDAAEVWRAPSRQLSDAFLLDISRRYLALGRGYARTLASEYNVAPRTVVSWVEKARRRGLLSSTSPGTVGGEVREQ